MPPPPATARPAPAPAATALSDDLILADLMRRWPESVAVLTDRRMACPGCAMAPFMTLAEAAAAYGIPPDALLADLRRALAEASGDAPRPRSPGHPGPGR